MAFTLATGSQVFVARQFGASKTMSAVTKAAEAVATLEAGHGITAGTYIEVTSGWGKLNQRIVRVKAVATNDVTLEGIDTTGSAFTASGGVGSVRAITQWTEVTQVKDLSSSGGDLQMADATSISDVVERKIPTVRSAITMNLTVYDDPALAWYADVTVASDSATPYGLKMVLANGSRLVANSYWSLNKVPSVTKNEVLTTQLSLTYAADPVRYAAKHANET